MELGLFLRSIPEKIPFLTFWIKNLWSLWTKNASEHIFWCNNSALRATYIMSINKKDPVVSPEVDNLLLPFSHVYGTVPSTSVVPFETGTL